MFQKMIQESRGNLLAYKAIGDITKEDYRQIGPEVESLAEEYGDVRLLLDLTQFHWEKISAWGEDWRFGRKFHDVIVKMAIVGDKKWEAWLTKLAGLFYAREARFFHPHQMEDALKWLTED